ncbi:hypothetical protein [Acetobacterium sp.]|uniref:hypothetical protein n=1 Tax=Acetobacterium sp. TaxID=1872094 RepID=UPI00359343C7
MKIAMTTNGKTLDSLISDNFDANQKFLVVKISDMSTEEIAISNDLTAADLAQKVIDLNCEGIITGNFLSEKAFDLLADGCVTRYLGSGYSVAEAIKLMEKRTLPLIRNFEGTDKCSGDHH